MIFTIDTATFCECSENFAAADPDQSQWGNITIVSPPIYTETVLSRWCGVLFFQCYGKFTEFDFSPYQEEVFSALVWPQVTKLPQECIQNPTPLMKLLLTWTQHQQWARDSSTIKFVYFLYVYLCWNEGITYSYMYSIG
jgi:hypothetical protein